MKYSHSRAGKIRLMVVVEDMMKKNIQSSLKYIWIALGVLTLAACNRTGFGDTAGPGVTGISMQISWAEDSGRGKVIREILDVFEVENPDIKVDLLPANPVDSWILAQVVSGQAPDILQTNYQNLWGQAPDRVFQDIGMEFSEEGDAFYEKPWEMGQFGGIQYGVPWMGHTVQLVYNEDLFTAAGLTRPPANWEELYDYAKQLTVDTDGDGEIDQWGIGLVGKQDNDIIWMVNMFIHQGGARIVDISGGRPRVALNSPEGIRALAFYKKLITECAPPDSGNKAAGDVMEDFRNQVVAMELQGPWGVTDIWKADYFDANTAHVPAGPAGRFSEMGLEYLTIPVGVAGEKREAAIRVIKFLASPWGQEMLLKGELAEDGNYYPFRLPIRTDAADSLYFQENPEFQPFIDGFAFPCVSTPVESWYQVQQEVYKSELNKVVLGLTSVEAALAEIERAGNAILIQEL
jgi:ABC-type glycerol-3-phosphate transport system substrate-binding protein